MKKAICILFAAMLLIGTAAAEYDLSTMTNDELIALRNQIDAELLSRNPPTNGDLICDDSRVRLVLTSYEIYDTRSGKVLSLVCEWMNKDDEPESLYDWVSVKVTSGSRSLSFRNNGMYDIIRANASLSFSIDIEVPDWADSVDVEFRSFWKPSDVFKSYTFNLR